MKIKEVIKQLNELDATGELEVSVGLADIHYIERLPSYYDGYQQVLIRHPDGFFPLGGKYNTKNDKIVISELGFSDVLMGDPDLDFPIDYSGLPEGHAKRYKEFHDKRKEDGFKITTKIDFESLLEFCSKKASHCGESLDGLYDVVKEYFNKVYDRNMGWKIHPIFKMTWKYDKDLKKTVFSKNSICQKDAEHYQWLHTLEIRYDNGWYIKEVPDKFYSEDFRKEAEKWWKKNK